MDYRGMSEYDLLNYRIKLVNYGQRYIMENPDCLELDEMAAVSEVIFKQANALNKLFGRPSVDSGVELPANISKIKQEELFGNFLDWCQVIKTPNQAVFDYILKNYPAKEYHRILCVGDGAKSHLGRKLAMNGYRTVSVDPEAQTQFSWKKGYNPSNNKKGKFTAVKACFYDNSEDMINWADVIVGCKVPPIVEHLVKVDKPAVFTISNNPEIYNLQFNGVPITSKKLFEEEIKKCKGIKAISAHTDTGIVTIFEKNGREKNDDPRF